jgi:hypothetical protein
MKNKLGDLRDHLFAEIERMGDESLTSDQLIIEAGRARTICMVAEQIVAVDRLVIDAIEVASIPNADGRITMLLGDKQPEPSPRKPGHRMALIS